MVSTTIIIPELTELNAIQDKIQLIDEFSILPVGEELVQPTPNVFVDLTFNYFDKALTPQYLYHYFATMQDIKDSLSFNRPSVLLIKHYPFSTENPRMMLCQRILDQFVEIFLDTIPSQLILVPFVVSRYSLSRISNPVLDIIQSVRMGKSVKVEVSPQSRFSIIYALDLLTVFLQIIDEDLDKPLVVEGIEMSLREVASFAQKVAGQNPVSFDNHNFFNVHFPDISAHFISHINYEFENMMIDLISNLF